MSPALHFLGPFFFVFATGPAWPRADLFLLVQIVATLCLFLLLQHHWHKQARSLQARRHSLAKRISEFGERLAVSPLEEVDAAILAGLDNLVSAADAERICWYELAPASNDLERKYTASVPLAPSSPQTIPPHRMPFMSSRLARHEVVLLRSLSDLPPEADAERSFLSGLGVKSLLLIPSNFSPTRKGVLGFTSYSSRKNWPDDSIGALALAANILGATVERKYAQSAGAESEERFRYLFAQASIGVAIETLQGNILDVNPAFCSMLGYSSEELLASTCAHLSHPEDEKLELPLFDELRRGLRPSYQIEKRFFRKDGSHMWGQVSVSLLNRNHGRPPLVIGMVIDFTAQKKAEASLRLRDRELQRLAGHLIKAQEEERRRISRELHDDIGQRLALLACELDLERNGHSSTTSHDSHSDVLSRFRMELDAIATDIHELSHELHSSSLQVCGLKVALKDLCHKYSHNHNLNIELHADHLDTRLSPDSALCLFRVAQEALANVIKHGQTKRVLINVVQDSDSVRLSVKDFGIGFDPSIHSPGIGLMSMRERLRSCGGQLSISSAHQCGTEITARLKLPRALAASASG